MTKEELQSKIADLQISIMRNTRLTMHFATMLRWEAVGQAANNIELQCMEIVRYQELLDKKIGAGE